MVRLRLWLKRVAMLIALIALAAAVVWLGTRCEHVFGARFSFPLTVILGLIGCSLTGRSPRRLFKRG